VRYPIPIAVRQAATRALALRRQYGRGGTDVGMGTARRLARGGAVPFEFVKKISEYFPRHAGDRLDDPTSNGSIAWGLWGGDAGRRWSEGVMARTKKANPKVVISQLVKRVASAGKFDGSEYKGKQVDPRVVEKQWKRQAVIHGVAEYGAPVQKLLRDEYETAFWQGAARGLANPAGEWSLQYMATFPTEAEASQALTDWADQEGFIGGKVYQDTTGKYGKRGHWVMQGFLEDVGGGAHGDLPDGVKRVMLLPSMRATLSNPAPKVTDRALRYRANANPPKGPKQCLWCNSKKNVEVGHLDGHEENNKPANLHWTCRSCNTALGHAFKKLGIGRRTRQYNPSGAATLGQWLNAVQSAKGDSGGTMDLDAAIEMIRYTSPIKRSEFAREIWAKRRQAHGPTGRRNPEEPAAELYEKFHGKPSERVDVIEEEVHYHEHLAGLGQLIELKVKTPTKIRATLRFGEGPEAPILSSSEDGRQLYIVGGDQKLDLKAIEMDGSEWHRDLMTIGEITEVTYFTEKKFHKFEPVNYFHKLGEETGVKPTLLYDTRNERMMIAGGQYQVKPEGIVN